jgi:DNA-binding NtrC family response regulator
MDKPMGDETDSRAGQALLGRSRSSPQSTALSNRNNTGILSATAGSHRHGGLSLESAVAAQLAHERTQTAEDEDVVARCAATTLITASVVSDVERLARRIHAASPRAASPFVHVSASALPTDPGALSDACASLIEAASRGTLLITHVEQMPALVQDRFIKTLTQLQDARDPSAAVRLIAGTTVSLRERIADGTFSERLFYRLNIIHVIVKDAVLLRETTRRTKRRR